MRKKIAPWKLLQQIMGWEQTGAKNHKKDADGQTGVMLQTQLKTKPRRILLKLNSKEIKWTPDHINALLCSVSCVCLGRPN